MELQSGWQQQPASSTLQDADSDAVSSSLPVPLQCKGRIHKHSSGAMQPDHLLLPCCCPAVARCACGFTGRVRVSSARQAVWTLQTSWCSWCMCLTIGMCICLQRLLLVAPALLSAAASMPKCTDTLRLRPCTAAPSHTTQHGCHSPCNLLAQLPPTAESV